MRSALHTIACGVAAIAAAVAFAGCGSPEGIPVYNFSGEAPDPFLKVKLPDPHPESFTGHSVPDWMIGEWRVVRMQLGNNISHLERRMFITQTGFEYHYTDLGCNVAGELAMDDSLPPHASNSYELLMTSVDCPFWPDIESGEGAMDAGHIWSENGGLAMIRVSDIYAPTHVASYWVYLNVEFYPEFQ